LKKEGATNVLIISLKRGRLKKTKVLEGGLGRERKGTGKGKFRRRRLGGGEGI